jgi:RNA polymerase sigma-70 factor (ECF subfamily)
MSAPADLLAAARAGDAAAFERLVAPYLGELQAHCYRLLGSFHDAQDTVQDSLLRAWRGIGKLDERGLVRAWLYRIATNRCLTALDQRSRRELPMTVPPDTPATEINWLEPYPDPTPEAHQLAREDVELAFVAALQHLTPVQRAALILRDVLGFSAAEVAAQLDTTAAAVHSALQRARAAVPAAPSQHTIRRELGENAVARIASRWAEAWQARDVDSIVTMLTDDARYCMPPLPLWYRGRAEIRAFLRTGPLQSRWRFLPTTANSQLAFGTYLWDHDTQRYVPGGLDILTLDRRGTVSQVTAFLTADLTRFGLPANLAA